MVEAIPLPLHCDPERTQTIVEAILLLVDGERTINVISACHSVVCDAVMHSSVDLPGAIANVDSLAGDAKKFLREKMGN